MRDALTMRTTLDIDEDVLEASKELAAQRGTTAGRVISELARSALAPRSRTSRKRNGVPLLPEQPKHPARLVTPAIVNRLRDEP
jgi:hypothetical protein